MGVGAEVKGKLAGLIERIRAWAHSVPPDVWIGLAIAAATLIVVWLAYNKSSGASTTSTDTGVINPTDTSGGSGGSSTFSSPSGGTILGGLPGLPSLPAINWPTGGIVGGVKAQGGATPGTIIPTPSLTSIYNQIEANGQNATIASQQAAAAAQATYMTTLNQNEANGQQATIAATQRQQAATTAYLQSIPASTPTETTIAQLIQKVAPKPAPAPTPVRINPYVITATPTGRGVNIGI